MNRSDFPGAIAHGEAWWSFHAQRDANHHLCNEDELGQRWAWFLKGWQAKGKQRTDLRGK